MSLGEGRWEAKSPIELLSAVLRQLSSCCDQIFSVEQKLLLALLEAQAVSLKQQRSGGTADSSHPAELVKVVPLMQLKR